MVLWQGEEVFHNHTETKAITAALYVFARHCEQRSDLDPPEILRSEIAGAAFGRPQ